MDEISQKRFDEIIAKDLSSLTEADKSFLRARKTYISNKKQKELKDILGEPDPVIEPEPEVERKDWSEHPADAVEQTETADEEDDEAEG